MENNKFDYDYKNVIQLDDAEASSRKFIANVFLWMFLALAISAVCAYEFAFNPGLATMVVNPETHSFTGFGMVAMFSPLAFLLVMNFGMNRIAYPVLTLLFIAYAAMTGISLSVLFYVYSATAMAGVFGIAALVFGIMAVAGYTTHQDLTKFGSILFMLLIGVVLATLANMFIQSLQLDLLITYVGVAVFVGLVAYKVQMLKRIGAGLEYGDATSSKLALMGALTLYISFINLFLFLLRLFAGGRRR